jgi:hypothetical protein
MAFQQSPGRQTQSLQHAMMPDRFMRISGAGRMEPAPGREKRGHPALVAPDREQADASHDAPFRSKNSARASAACQARRSLSAGSLAAWRLGRITRSHPAGIPSRLNRASSLKRRLHRLRKTAWPIFFPAMTTYRVRPDTFPRYRRVNRGPDRRLPSLKTIRISALLRRRYCEAERRWATDPIRPSTYAALWPDGEPGPGAHP